VQKPAAEGKKATWAWKLQRVEWGACQEVKGLWGGFAQQHQLSAVLIGSLIRLTKANQKRLWQVAGREGQEVQGHRKQQLNKVGAKGG